MRSRESSAVASGGSEHQQGGPAAAGADEALTGRDDWGSPWAPSDPALPEGDEADGADDPDDLVATDEAIFGREYPALRRFAAVVAPPEMDPDDLVQEAVSRVLRRGSLRGLDNPGAYLRRTIVNLAANERRRLGRWRRARIRSTPPAADDARPAEYPSDVADLLRLPPATRAALWLADVEGWSFDEIALLLGSTTDAVKARASRARRSLRHTINEEER
jgi:RNA polymerase sigma-70 factor (ECF subfamily)